LLDFKEKHFPDEKSEPKIKRYKLTLLKKSYQSIKPSQIKENIEDLKNIYHLFRNLEPIIKRLNLSPEIIRYYAQVVIKSRIFQIIRRDEEKKYLLLIAFVIHQYYKLNDTLIEILLKSVKSIQNSTTREHKENIYETRTSRYKTMNSLAKSFKNNFELIESIKNIIEDNKNSSENKIEEISKKIIDNEKIKSENIEQQIQLLNKDSENLIKNTDYFNILESKAVKLQNRVKAIIQEIVFDSKTSNNYIIEAIDYYKNHKGVIEEKPPTNFLDKEQRKIIIDKNGLVKKSLYKVLLFENIASALKSGSLNLIYSYQFKAFDSYLIPKETWNQNKTEILVKTGLKKYKIFNNLESRVEILLENQYSITNKNILNKTNEYVKIKDNGQLVVKTPAIDKSKDENTVELFPKNNYISLFEILSTISKTTCFIDSFEHWKIKHNRNKPKDKTFYAGIIGYGCNLGIRKTAKITKNINQNELENTVNWYFSLDNINQANDKIVSLMDNLKLSKVFKADKQKIHTSSDGQKYNIAVESLNSNYSYKYFGKGKGVTVYSFIDESHKLFYSTVISSSEREASYVIDGLMHNDVVKSDIHSTDTHGYNEMIFAVTHLLGISFAPRIKNFQKQNLYNFDSKLEMKNKGYKILPNKIINTQLINEHWDDILRFIATIKLKHTTASQLFKRLSSYSKQHPLYRALKEFGKIIKTLFLLKYIDDVKLRQKIEKQLNKLESSNKFGKAIFHGNNQEFQYATKEEQLIVDACKRLIENAIICWNYLYLSQRIHDEENEQQKGILVKNIKNKSMIFWHHINLAGEYDFDEKNMDNFVEFNIPKLLELNVG
jgi:TnpA family transposase